MKAITIKNPWAYLIVRGIKDIENRSWKTNYRGKVLIHVSKSCDKRFFDKTNDESYKIICDTVLNSLSKEQYYSQNSCIIGEVEIVDCVINHPSIWAEKSNTVYQLAPEETSEDYPKPIYNWVLANAKMYDDPIFNVKGKQSFWEYEL